MTVESTTRRQVFTCDGSQVDFVVTYPFISEEDLLVFLVDGDGNETSLVRDTDFTVSSVTGEFSSGGTVTTLTTYDAPYTISVIRQLTIIQLLDILEGDKFPANNVERALDRLTMICQQLQEDGVAIAIGGDHGSVLYFNGVDWTFLRSGTDGQFLQTRGEGQSPIWSTPAGAGDVVGPLGATDNAIPVYDGISGKLIKDTGLTLRNLLTIMFNGAGVESPFNMPALNTPPSATPAVGDTYLDDGTNTLTGIISFRRWNGSIWEDLAGIGAVNDINIKANLKRIMRLQMEQQSMEYEDGFIDDFTDEDGVDPVNPTGIDRAVYDVDNDQYLSCLRYEQLKTKMTFGTGLGTNSGGWSDYTIRQVIPKEYIHEDGEFIRVAVRSGADGLYLDNLSIVERDTGMNGITTPTELLFEQSSGVQIEDANMIMWSDLTSFTLDKTKDYLLIADFSTSTYDDVEEELSTMPAEFLYYHNSNQNSFNIQIPPDPLNYTTVPASCIMFAGIEVRESSGYTKSLAPVSDVYAKKMNAFYEVDFSDASSVTFGDKIYTFGGTGDTDACRIYDPATNTIVYGRPMPNATATPVAVTDGTYIYIMGEAVGMLRYDPATDTYQEMADAPLTLAGAVACYTDEGTAGKIHAFALLVHYIYDIDTDAWTSHGTAIPYSLTNGACWWDGGDYIYIFGDETAGSNLYVYRWHLTDETWERLPNLIYDYFNNGPASLEAVNNKLYFLGNSTGITGKVVEYDLDTFRSAVVYTFNTTDTHLTSAVYDGKIYTHNSNEVMVIELPTYAIGRKGRSYNLCRNGEPIASTESSATYKAKYAFDVGDESSWWDGTIPNGSQTGAEYIGYMSNTKWIANKFIIKQYDVTNTNYQIDSVLVQGFDGDDWVTIDTVALTKGVDLGFETHSFTNENGSYYGYRLLANAEAITTWAVLALRFEEEYDQLEPYIVELRSTIVEADADNPLVAYVSALIEPIDSITLNNELIFEVSMNGGTDWEQVTMELKDTQGLTQYIAGEEELTPRSDNQMVLRVRTANAGSGEKRVKIQAYNFAWSY
jgi:hypothetical protein